MKFSYSRVQLFEFFVLELEMVHCICFYFVVKYRYNFFYLFCTFSSGVLS